MKKAKEVWHWWALKTPEGKIPKWAIYPYRCEAIDSIGYDAPEGSRVVQVVVTVKEEAK